MFVLDNQALWDLVRDDLKLNYVRMVSRVERPHRTSVHHTARQNVKLKLHSIDHDRVTRAAHEPMYWNYRSYLEPRYTALTPFHVLVPSNMDFVS